jgi:small GTP-binding protein
LELKTILDSLRDELAEHNPHLTHAQLNEVWGRVEERIASEPPPRIAVIGETGVGKSSTLNALFNAGQSVGHALAETQIETELTLRLETLQGEHGEIIVYDMPGLGESIAAHDRHLQTYDRVLKDVDVGLWILDAQDRAIESVQNYLRDEISDINKAMVDRMVFALNKIDLVHPNDWVDAANMPSKAQEGNIALRIADVQSKVSEAVPTWRGRVVGYSAARRYNLPQLFASMLEGVGMSRKWVLASRKALANFFEFVDPQLLPEDRIREQGTRRSLPSDDHVVREAVRQLGEDEFASLTHNKDGFLHWLGTLVDHKT